MYKIMSSQMSVLLLPFQFGCLLFFSACLISMGKTPSTVLNKSGKSWYSCLFPILRKTFVVFAHWVWSSRGCLIYDLYYIEVCSMYSHSAESFYHIWVLDLIKCFLCVYWYDHVVFILHFVCVVYHVYWFADIVPTSHPLNKSHLIIVYGLFNLLLDPVC